MDLSQYIETVRDFPIPGNNALDMTRLYNHNHAFNYGASWFIEQAVLNKIEHIVAIETRGLIWGSITAFNTKLPLHIARKPHKIPGEGIRKYFTSRKRPYTLAMVTSSFISGNVMIIDDTVVSGATMSAVGDMLTEAWGIAPNKQFHTALIYAGQMPGKQMLIEKGYNVANLVRID